MIEFLFYVFAVIVIASYWFVVGHGCGKNDFMQELVDSGEAEWNADKSAITIKK